MAHTPTPWTAGTYKSGGWPIYAKQGCIDVCPAMAHGESDAAFIVKSVNMHDELVSAIGKIDSIMRRNLTATNKLDKIAGILTDIDPVLAKAREA